MFFFYIIFYFITVIGCWITDLSCDGLKTFESSSSSFCVYQHSCDSRLDLKKKTKNRGGGADSSIIFLCLFFGLSVFYVCFLSWIICTITLLCREQGNRSLEEHLEEFLSLAHLTTFPDVPARRPEHRHQSAVVQGGSSRELCKLCRVGAGIMQIIYDHRSS